LHSFIATTSLGSTVVQIVRTNEILNEIFEYNPFHKSPSTGTGTGTGYFSTGDVRHTLKMMLLRSKKQKTKSQ
jgi:hypothetical protein